MSKIESAISGEPIYGEGTTIKSAEFLPYFPELGHPLIESPSNARFYGLALTAPMGIRILDNGMTLPAYPSREGTSKTNGWGLEQGTTRLRMETVKELFKSGNLTSKTHLFAPSSVPPGALVDNLTPATTDWAGDMIRFYHNLLIPHLRVTTAHTYDTFSEMAEFARMISENPNFNRALNITELSLHGPRQMAFLDLILMAKGHRGDWLGDFTEKSLNMVATQPGLDVFRNEANLERLTEYIITNEPDQKKAEKMMATLRYVVDFAKNPMKHLGSITFEQLKHNAKQTFKNLAKKRGVDVLGDFKPYIVEILEERRPEIKLVGVEHVYAKSRPKAQYLNSVWRTPEIHLTAMSSISGSLDAIQGFYYSEQRSLYRDDLMRTGRSPIAVVQKSTVYLNRP